VTGVSIGGRAEPVSELGASKISGIKVSAAQEHIQFDFLGLSFKAGDVLRYQYRIGGGAWSAPMQSRAVHYGSLPAGSYRFEVRAVNSDGQASREPAEVDFRVIPPVWQRAWFEGVIALMAVGGAVWVHRARVRRLVEIERVRTRIATDLHDDIGSSLSQIAILSEVAQQRAARGDAAEPLKRIGTLSRELLDSISDIVWTIQPERDRLSDLQKRMRRFATEVLSARNVEIDWPAAETERDWELDTELRRQTYLIFKEAVNNIARHSGATKARITVGTPGRRLIMEISDNGRGIERFDAGGNGLSNMKLRATRIKGELQVSSGNGQGTTVVLRVPLLAS
jgi:signal transduction histidine kinase